MAVTAVVAATAAAVAGNTVAHVTALAPAVEPLAISFNSGNRPVLFVPRSDVPPFGAHVDVRDSKPANP